MKITDHGKLGEIARSLTLPAAFTAVTIAGLAVSSHLMSDDRNDQNANASSLRGIQVNYSPEMK